MAIPPHTGPTRIVCFAIKHGKMAVALGTTMLLAACHPSTLSLAEQLGCERKMLEESLIQSDDFFDVHIDAKFVLCQRSERRFGEDAELFILSGQENEMIERFQSLTVYSGMPSGEALKLIPLRDDLPEPEDCEPGDCDPKNYREGQLIVWAFGLSPELARSGVMRSTKQLVLIDGQGTQTRWFVQNGEWRRYFLD